MEKERKRELLMGLRENEKEVRDERKKERKRRRGS